MSNDEEYICKIPNIDEMNEKWDCELIESGDDNGNHIVWKKRAIDNFTRKKSIPYYGMLNGVTISQATAMICDDIVQNSENLVDETTAYLCAFRTTEEYQGKGYFSKLFKYMIDDLKNRGYKNVSLGVESNDIKNQELYRHLGFTEYIKTDNEVYPDGTVINVEYYKKEI